jgi:hypothetical protein
MGRFASDVASATWSFRSSLRLRLAILLGQKLRDGVGANRNAHCGEQLMNEAP